jgi:hypothetical protein
MLELKFSAESRSFGLDIIKLGHLLSSTILSEPSQIPQCSEQLSSDQCAALQAKRSELQAQLLVLLPQAHSSPSLDSPPQPSKLQDVTLQLQACQSQKLRGE